MPANASSDASLVLITGAGRSGTSTIAGTLFRLGSHVPEPYLQGNESNPRGFYESWWPVRFHKRLISRANIEQTDGRPDAADSVRTAVDDKARAELGSWLDELVATSDRLVVKDPRAIWVPWLWNEVAEQKGIRLSFLTMLRHPAEVVGSRSTYYADNRAWMAARDFSTMNLCGWINGNLTLERQTRGQRRTFVLYDELLDDWRAQIAKIATEIDVPLDPTPEQAAEVDGFVEPTLRRHAPEWGEPELPSTLREIAEDTFAAFARLAAAGGNNEQIQAEIDQIAERYRSLYADATAIAQDAASARARDAKREGKREARNRRARKGAVPASPTASRGGVSRPRALARAALSKSATLRRLRERIRTR